LKHKDPAFGAALHAVLDVMPVAWRAFAEAAAVQDNVKAEQWASLCFGLFEGLDDVDSGREIKWTARDVMLAAAGWDAEIGLRADVQERR
jgi:hypothetical protein